MQKYDKFINIKKNVKDIYLRTLAVKIRVKRH
jgi:hypothetical protein